MKLDHIAYRVPDRDAFADFYCTLFGYTKQAEFYPFKDSKVDGNATPDSQIECVALVPNDKTQPEIFISSGPPDSIVGKWVKKYGGGIHHIAYEVESVQGLMDKWRKGVPNPLNDGNGKHYLAFTTEEPIVCPEDDLIQVFTRGIHKMGEGPIIYEFIQRGEHGFCSSSVKKLMESTKE